MVEGNECHLIYCTCVSNAVNGMESPVGEEREASAKQEGMDDAVEDPALCHSSTYLDDCGVEIAGKLAAKPDGICLEEVTSSSLNGAITTGDIWTAEDADDCIVDFLDKNNNEVYLPLSYH